MDDGGLQFDNAECGVALLELYELTKEPKYLDAAKKAADWALARPLVSNWNYNSFSAYLLVRTYRVTGDKKVSRCGDEEGVARRDPGQLTEGKYAGRWHDPHKRQAGVSLHHAPRAGRVGDRVAERKRRAPRSRRGARAGLKGAEQRLLRSRRAQ